MDNEKSFSCVLCGSKLPSKEALQEHFRKHANKEIDTKGNPITKPPEATQKVQDNTSSSDANEIHCDVCPMKFQTVTQAIQHKFRKHPESSLKYYCPFCGMQFPLKYTKDKHVQSHTGMSSVGSFPCPECGVVFHNTGAQSYHVKSTHKRILSIFKPIPTPPPSKKIKINNANEAQSVYYCYLCGSEYVIKFNLQKHLERAHTEEERNTVPQDLIKCTTCDALFYNKKAYDTHNMYHKPDDLYVTSEEQRLQTVSRVDQDFDIRRVQLTTEKFIPIDRPKQKRRIVKKIELQSGVSKNGLKKELDEELSPNSSIDSSDSEKESKKNTPSKLKGKGKIVRRTEQKEESKAEPETVKEEIKIEETKEIKIDETKEIKTEDKEEIKTEDKEEIKTEDKEEIKTEDTEKIKSKETEEKSKKEVENAKQVEKNESKNSKIEEVVKKTGKVVKENQNKSKKPVKCVEKIKTRSQIKTRSAKNKKDSESSVETSDEEKKCVESQQNKTKLPKKSSLLKNSTPDTDKRKRTSTNRMVKKQKI